MPDDRTWWRRTCRLAAVVLLIWAVVGVAIHAGDVLPAVAGVSPRSFGYLLAELVAPAVMVIVLLAFLLLQRQIDRSRGLGED
jgi:putative solute:sodium symporter small subunit